MGEDRLYSEAPTVYDHWILDLSGEFVGLFIDDEL